MSEELTVTKDVVVGLAYTLYVDGAVEDSAPASAPLEYLQGHGNLISGLEKALEGMKAGEHTVATITPEEGYGEYDPDLVAPLERTLFTSIGFPVEKGRAVALVDDEGQHSVGYICDMNEDTVFVDRNHPMAGKTLKFECEIVTLRHGTPEEIEAGTIYLEHHGCDCGCSSDCSSCGGHCH